MNKRTVKIFFATLIVTLLCGSALTAAFLYKSRPDIPDENPVTDKADVSVPTDTSDDTTVQVMVEPIPEPTQPPFEEYDITVMAVGDNLLHLGIVNSGRECEGRYNYDFLFDSIRPYLDKSDISIINQETVMAGNELGFSGFPYFNSPTEVADAIDNAGFNVVLQASNHTIDQGMKGLLNVCSVWEITPI